MRQRCLMLLLFIPPLTAAHAAAQDPATAKKIIVGRDEFQQLR